MKKTVCCLLAVCLALCLALSTCAEAQTRYVSDRFTADLPAGGWYSAQGNPGFTYYYGNESLTPDDGFIMIYEVGAEKYNIDVSNEAKLNQFYDELVVGLSSGAVDGKVDSETGSMGGKKSRQFHFTQRAGSFEFEVYGNCAVFGPDVFVICYSDARKSEKEIRTNMAAMSDSVVYHPNGDGTAEDLTSEPTPECTPTPTITPTPSPTPIPTPTSTPTPTPSPTPTTPPVMPSEPDEEPGVSDDGAVSGPVEIVSGDEDGTAVSAPQAPVPAKTKASFEETVERLSAMKHDGATVLSLPDQGITKADYFRGAVLSINVAEGTARFSLHHNDSDTIYVWAKVDEDCVPHLMDLVPDILNDYVDYDRGGKIDLYIYDNTTSMVYDDIAYTPNIEALRKNEPETEYTGYYDDWEAFKEVAAQEISKYYKPKR